jgi:hypothetical protein
MPYFDKVPKMKKPSNIVFEGFWRDLPFGW